LERFKIRALIGPSFFHGTFTCSLGVSFQAFFCKDIFAMKLGGFLWWEMVLLAAQIAFIGLVGVITWLIVFEE